MDIDTEQEIPEHNRIHEWGRRARHSARWVGVTTAGWQLLSWVLTVLTANFLIPSDYGVMSLAETLLPYFLLVASFYSRTWIVQVREFSDADGEAMMSYTTLLGIVASVGVFVAAPFAAEFYGDISLALPFRVIAIGMAFRSFTAVTEAVLGRDLQFKELSVLTAVIAVSRGVMQLALAYCGFGFWALVLGYIYRDLATTAGLMIIKGVPKRFGWNVKLYRAALKFGLPATASALLGIIFASADRVIIGKILGAEILGFYAFAAYIADLPTAKINMMFRSVLVSYFSRLKDTPQVLAQQFLKICRGACVVTFPTLVGMAAVASDAVPLLLGKKWEPMVVPLQVMSIVCLIRAFVDMVPPLLTSFGLPGRVLVYNIVSTTLLPLSMLIGVWHWGLWGAYGTWLCILPLLTWLLLSYLQKALKIRVLEFLNNLTAPFVASVVMGISVWGFGVISAGSMPPFTVLVLKIFVGLSVYVATLFGLFRTQWRETIEMLRAMRE